MSTATQPVFVKDAWQTPRNARTLQAFMALRNEQIAARLRALREGKGSPPQTAVAEALGVGERTYQTWENAEAKPGYENLQRLATYYGVGEEYILTGEGTAPQRPSDDEEMGQLDRIEELLIENQNLMRRLAAGLLADAPADPPWQNLAEVLASLDARDRAASPHVPQPRTSSTG